MTTTTTEEFTFPTITDTFSFSIDSPPLWHLSPSASPEPTRRSERDGSHVDKEDKMDMLWEDFNEELFTRNSTKDGSSRFDSGRINMGCAQALRLSKSDVTVFNPKNSKLGLVVFVKVLKKFFLLHTSHRSVHRKPQFSWS